MRSQFNNKLWEHLADSDVPDEDDTIERLIRNPVVKTSPFIDENLPLDASFDDYDDDLSSFVVPSQIYLGNGPYLWQD